MDNMREAMIGLTATEAAVQELLPFFDRREFPEEVASEPFRYLAKAIAEVNGNSPQTVVALQKLLESKDAAVRAAKALRKPA